MKSNETKADKRLETRVHELIARLLCSVKC